MRLLAKTPIHTDPVTFATSITLTIELTVSIPTVQDIKCSCEWQDLLAIQYGEEVVKLIRES